MPKEPSTSSKTFLLLTRITTSSSVKPTPSRNVVITENNSASAEISLVPQISTFH